MNEKIMKEYYEEMLDEMFPKTKVAGIDYTYSYVLKRINLYAYYAGMNDYEIVLREAHAEDGSYADLFGDEEE